MIIREAVAADVDAIVALLADDALGRTREAPGDPAYGRAFAAIAAQGGNVILVAEEAGALIGCLQLTFIPGLSHRGRTRAQIEGVRVAAAARGRGVGQRLIEAALNRARDAGCGLAQLTSDVRRTDARRFYERLGFEASHVGMKRAL
jgi:ribosomal protein S18 acetylase RimI-like enzyme